MKINRQVLVTGGGGFLGRYIVEQLRERGDAVTVFARGNYPELARIGATVARGDVQDARAIAGQLMQVGEGKNRVDITYVEDAARAHLLAADALQPGSPVAGSVYFISQDAPVNLWGWIRELLPRLHIPPMTRAMSLTTARTIGAVMEFVWRNLRLSGEPRMTRFLASELALDHYYDISRAKRDFGYAPQFSMNAALERTLPFLR